MSPVPRWLFEPIKDLKTRDAVCRAFADIYREEAAKLPSETQEGRYYDRLTQAYPIHPEVFDRLYEDWTTLQGFQRTLALADVIERALGGSKATWKVYLAYLRHLARLRSAHRP